MQTHNATFANQRWPLFFRGPLTVLIGLFLLVLAPGCAHNQQELSGFSFSGLDVQPEGRIALIVKDPSASQTLEAHGSGKLPDIGRGSATGAMYGAGTCAQFGRFAAPLAIILMPVCATAGAAGGAVYGAVAAGDSGRVEEFYLTLTKSMEKEQAKQKVATHAVQYAVENGIDVWEVQESDLKNQQDLVLAKGYWAALEIEDLLVEIEPNELLNVDQRWQLIIQARAKLTRASDKTVLADRLFTDNKGRSYYMEDWVGNETNLFRREVNLALSRLSKDIIDTFFVQTQLPSTVISLDSSLEAIIHGPVPVSPTPFESLNYRFAEVDSIFPTFRWNALDKDDVTYDLRIWLEYGYEPLILVYHQDGIKNTKHTIDIPLMPSSWYFYTLRAHFKENGRSRVSEWSRYTIRRSKDKAWHEGDLGWLASSPPEESFYKFKTPDLH